MKKLCGLILLLLVFTGCQQKKELSDLELVKIAREYMSVMNPGKVEKAPASVSSWDDFSLNKKGNYERTKFTQVVFFSEEWEQWRVRIQDGKTVADVLMPPEMIENERKERKLPMQQQKNCWGNYMLWQEWMK